MYHTFSVFYGSLCGRCRIIFAICKHTSIYHFHSRLHHFLPLFCNQVYQLPDHLPPHSSRYRRTCTNNIGWQKDNGPVDPAEPDTGNINMNNLSVDEVKAAIGQALDAGITEFKLTGPITNIGIDGSFNGSPFYNTQNTDKQPGGSGEPVSSGNTWICYTWKNITYQ